MNYECTVPRTIHAIKWTRDKYSFQFQIHLLKNSIKIVMFYSFFCLFRLHRNVYYIFNNMSWLPDTFFYFCRFFFAGENRVSFKRVLPTICHYSNALVVKKKRGGGVLTLATPITLDQILL